MTTEPRQYQIVRLTACMVDGHAWLFSGNSTSPRNEPPDDWRCDCKQYTWAEWKEHMDKLTQVAK